MSKRSQTSLLEEGTPQREPRPWPDGSERLFEGEHSPFVAVRIWGMDLMAYANSYRRAAEMLFEAHAGKGQTDNFLVFPLTFLWRHYLELSLKCLLAMIPDEKAGRERGEFPDGHSLLQLWIPVHAYLRERTPSEENAHVDAVIRRLDAADPDGDGFRYPVGSKKRARRENLTSVPANVDMGELDRSMRNIGNYIDASVSMFAAEWDAVPPADWFY